MREISSFIQLKKQKATPLRIAIVGIMFPVVSYARELTMHTRKLLYLDASPARHEAYAQYANALSLEAMACPDEGKWMELCEHCDTLSILVIGAQTPVDESLRAIEYFRLSPFHASLPIALILAERDTEIACQAMDAGVTEVFLQTETSALSDFIADCVTSAELPSYTGKALLVEDDEIFAEYVASLCNSMGFEVTQADRVEDAIEALLKTKFQIIITDVVLKGTKTGLSLLRHAHQAFGKNFPVIVTSGFDDLPRRLMALKNGVSDFISKPFAGEEFIWRVQRVMQLSALNEAGPIEIPPSPDREQGIRNDISQMLSPREHEIFISMVKGCSDKEIAASLGISYWTVRTHVQQIFAKTGAINRRELMARHIAVAGNGGQ